MHLTDLVADTGVVEDALGRRRLAGIDVRHDADVADLGEVGQHVLCHGSLPTLSIARLAVVLRRRHAVTAAGVRSPAVVREGPVRLGHLVGVLASLDGGTQAIAGVEELVGEPLDHGLLAALPARS